MNQELLTVGGIGAAFAGLAMLIKYVDGKRAIRSELGIPEQPQERKIQQPLEIKQSVVYATVQDVERVRDMASGCHKRIDGVERQLREMDGNLRREGEERAVKIHERINEVDARITGVDRKLAAIEERTAMHGHILTRIEIKLDQIKNQ